MPYWIHSAPDDLDDLRECARADRCADPRLETVGGKTVRRGAFTPRAYCDSCRGIIERAIRELPAYWGRVYATLGQRGQSAGPKVSISKSAPIPISLAADELLRDVASVVVSWWERVATVARLRLPDTGASQRLVSYDTVRAACSVLAAHVDALLALEAQPMMRSLSLREAADLPAGTTGLVHRSAEYADVLLDLDGADAGLEMLQLHYRCRRHVGETSVSARHLPTPCQSPCGYKQLYEVLNGDGEFDGAKCRQCGVVYTAQEYRDLVAATGDMIRRAGVRRRSLAVPGYLDDTEARRA
ncbi:hypothetical protein OIE13_22490 [Streptosporangium sp. NBC_01810]|uniref:hypothetical protein n=1 Tax=Streptosporangium sp. NBC_01810 TaxID=2975951 RepID=UPI002DD9B1E1|nr:hypothetical protein [Streptosporangium sp. NBC_01810]WSA23713.1 hypothetical protein OIE13_22490 [Streptosporangium sp. NBC_01810]